MKVVHAILGTLLLAAAATAQEPTNTKETLQRLSSSAQRQLAAGVEELSRLRERIASEKLPLAQSLTTSEETLSKLRRESDALARTVDESNLQLAALKAESKARQDELAYVGNLLDEYARTFESRVNVCELQYCGPALAAAKQASENTALTGAEKFERQLALVSLSLQRVQDALGGMRFPGVAVDLKGALAEGTFALLGPVALFSANGGQSAGLVVPQTGSPNPLIRPLDGALQAGLVSLVESGEGTLPVDPSLGGALKALVQKTSLIHVFEKGGPIMWPLLCASILALGTVIERLLFLMRERVLRDPVRLDAFFAAVGRGDTQAALVLCKESRFFVLRALGQGLAHKETSLQSAILSAQAHELKRYRRGIPILDTVITLAPLLGLLGTIVGMMGSFSLIGGDLGAPGAITGGIAEALIATAFGLGIAITALLPFNFLNARTDEARHELEAAATQLELMLQPGLRGDVVLQPSPPPVPPSHAGTPALIHS